MPPVAGAAAPAGPPAQIAPAQVTPPPAVPPLESPGAAGAPWPAPSTSTPGDVAGADRRSEQVPATGPLEHAPPPMIAASCTAPQLRRFIKSRPYVPMHELRRRFAINGDDDDVTAVELAAGRVFVGLPTREGGLLGELLRGGEVGYELSLDPRSPIVVGLYPMRPIPRS